MLCTLPCLCLDSLYSSSSPYARKVRITLAEKGIPFELQTEVPWDSTTKTPEYNPLEKLPVLIPDAGKPVYESHVGRPHPWKILANTILTSIS